MKNDDEPMGREAKKAVSDRVLSDPLLSEIGRYFFLSIARDAVRSGDVCLVGKNIDDSYEELKTYVSEYVKSDYSFVIDHREDLLKSGRQALADNNPMIAITLFATYFEHSLNDIVSFGAQRAGLSQAIARRLIKGSNIQDKCKDLLVELGLPPLPQELGRSIRKIAEIRNEFVHYKWSGKDESEQRSQDLLAASAIDSVEGAVAALTAYVTETFLQGFEDVVSRIGGID